MNKGYTEHYMTLCLAGLCDGAKHAVVVADKMISYECYGVVDNFSVEREDVTKIFKMNDTTALLISGNRAFGIELIEKLRKRLRRIRDIEKVNATMLKVYNDLSAEHAFHEKLFPAFKSRKEFLTMDLDERVRGEYIHRLQLYVFDLAVMTIGKENGVYRIYALENGSLNPKPEGHAAIGKGSTFVLKTLAKNYNTSLSRNEALKLLKAVKKVAEQEKPDLVGEKTDDEYLE